MSLDEFIIDTQQIPAMPQVIVKALGIIKSEESGINQLANIISYDQALCTQVLKLVNSAYYGFPQQISSIVKAISLIGMNQTKNIIMSVAMKSILTTAGGKTLWKHSISTAIASEFLAKKYKIMNPEEAFILGFLHDIGKILLDKKSPRLNMKANELAARGLDIIEAEEIFFKTNHADLGFFLASQWKLSIIVANAIKYHHDPLKSSMLNISALVYFADRLAKPELKKPYFNPEVEKKTNIRIEDPLGIKEIIDEKSSLLLSELIT